MNVQTEIAPSGSSLYYSLLYCDPVLRQKIIALRGFYQAVREIPFKSQDPSLIQIKFQWWREELDRLKTQTAQHPVTQILQSENIYTDVLQHTLLDIVEAFSQDTKTSLYENNADLDKFYFNTAGLLEKLLYDIKDQQILDQLSSLGIFVQKVLHLRELRTALSHGKIYFSGEQLLLHRVTLYELSQLKLTDNIQALFKSEAEKTYTDYYHKKNFNNLSPLAKPTLILANIYKKLLDEIAQTNFPLLTHKISLTPLRKWWIAWRT